jgi:hypothetical protein
MNTNVLSTLLSTVFLLSVCTAHAKNNDKNYQFVLGPVEVNSEQTLKVCSTDLSRVAKFTGKSREVVLSSELHGENKKKNRIVWSSTSVEVFDSTDTTRPLPVEVDDIVYASGKGGCATIPGYEMETNGGARSVIIVLTTVTEARSTFNPIVTGQLRPPGGDATCCGLMLPAVQRVL